jgi:hypothetical protein
LINSSILWMSCFIVSELTGGRNQQPEDGGDKTCRELAMQIHPTIHA